ncbi:hypothetical protein Cgig2_021453 [Carnegiea gigantea]|uniref:hAT-like transposase RNase-H fold domain-containing protein n=1 Tax=Carnegiea gigantea TaxID=171969 RepID=A0A9Q1K0P1_9CARY|nr:hypothetical protein Cgig2_021453 [Carnegiea gigantea]
MKVRKHRMRRKESYLKSCEYTDRRSAKGATGRRLSVWKTKENKHREWDKDPSPSLQDMAFQMHNKFNDYYGDRAKTNLMALVAVVYKLKFVKFSFRELYPNDFGKVDGVYDNLYNVLKRLYGSSASYVNAKMMIMMVPQSPRMTGRVELSSREFWLVALV